MSRKVPPTIYLEQMKRQDPSTISSIIYFRIPRTNEETRFPHNFSNIWGNNIPLIIFQPFPAYSVFFLSSLLPPITAYSSLLKSIIGIPVYSSILQPIWAYSNLFHLIQAYSILVQPPPTYCNLLKPFQSYSSLLQFITPYLGLF